MNRSHDKRSRFFIGLFVTMGLVWIIMGLLPIQAVATERTSSDSTYTIYADTLNSGGGHAAHQTISTDAAFENFIGSASSNGDALANHGYVPSVTLLVPSVLIIASPSGVLVASVSALPDGLQLQIHTSGNHQYTIEHSDDSPGPGASWTALIAGQEGDGELLTLEDTGATGLAKRFYRIRIEAYGEEFISQSFGFFDLEILPGPNLLSAASIAVDVRTDPIGTPRFFWSRDNPRAMPVGAHVWLVADLNGDGLFAGSRADRFEIKRILGDASENVLVYAGKTDGTLLGDQRGMAVFQGVALDPALAGADFYLLLWNDANLSGSIGDSGDTLGSLRLRRVRTSGLGNDLLLVDGDMYSDQIVVADTGGSVSLSSLPESNPSSLETHNDSSTRVLRSIQGESEGVGVIQEPATYDQWRRSFFGELRLFSGAGENQDPDGDGLCNGLEFLAGTDPLRRDSGVLDYQFVRAKTGSFFEIHIPVRTGRSGVLLRADYSKDFNFWEPYLGPSSVSTLEGGIQQWTYRIPVEASAGFVRLRVQLDAGQDS